MNLPDIDERAHLHLELHRLRELVKAADLHHIRLRDGLRTALNAWQSLVESEYVGTRRYEPTMAELRKLVTP